MFESAELPRRDAVFATIRDLETRAENYETLEIRLPRAF
jgi:hypothetical protein